MVKDPNFNELKEPRDHGRLWIKCSGASAQKLSNPGYYDGLTQSKIYYPNHCFSQIELDLRRTYPQ